MAFVVLASLVCVFFLSKPISAYLMGEGYARSVGVNISLFRTLLVLLSLSLIHILCSSIDWIISFTFVGCNKLRILEREKLCKGQHGKKHWITI